MPHHPDVVPAAPARTGVQPAQQQRPHTLAALPFFLRRKHDVVGAMEITSTTERIHGLLRLEPERLVVQWRVARATERVGMEIRTDREVEPVREVVLALAVLGAAAARTSGVRWLLGPQVVLTAADLRAFEAIAGEAGLKLDHPATLALRVERSDRLLVEEFVAELNLALAALPAGAHADALPADVRADAPFPEQPALTQVPAVGRR